MHSPWQLCTGFAVLVLALMQAACVTINLPPGPGTLEEHRVSGTAKDKILLMDISGVISSENKDGFYSSPGMLATVPAALLVFFVSSGRQHAVAGFAVTIMGVVWVGGGLAYLMLLRDIPENGRLLIFVALLTVFADDTAAYFVGRAIGRHRMAPVISPGKSWEGFVGGTVAAVAVSFFALYDQDVVTNGESLLLGLVVGLAATLGDLFESAVKRDLGVKDSGRLLAGHGGVLDRVDSLLWAGPAAYVALLALT